MTGARGMAETEAEGRDVAVVLLAGVNADDGDVLNPDAVDGRLVVVVADEVAAPADVGLAADVDAEEMNRRPLRPTA